ncbi:hypothetical protein V8F06_011193 [Rhypophila decipiens]
MTPLSDCSVFLLFLFFFCFLPAASLQTQHGSHGSETHINQNPKANHASATPFSTATSRATRVAVCNSPSVLGMADGQQRTLNSEEPPGDSSSSSEASFQDSHTYHNLRGKRPEPTSQPSQHSSVGTTGIDPATPEPLAGPSGTRWTTAAPGTVPGEPEKWKADGATMKQTEEFLADTTSQRQRRRFSGPPDPPPPGSQDNDDPVDNRDRRTGGSSPKLRRDDIGIFHPQWENPNGISLVANKKSIIFTNINDFNTRLRSLQAVNTSTEDHLLQL